MKKITYRELSDGSLKGRCGKKYISLSVRPHGGWYAFISENKRPIASEGYFTTSLPTLEDAKAWVLSKINTNN